jgi:hypothetical protein
MKGRKGRAGFCRTGDDTIFPSASYVGEECPANKHFSPRRQTPAITSKSSYSRLLQLQIPLMSRELVLVIIIMLLFKMLLFELIQEHRK